MDILECAMGKAFAVAYISIAASLAERVGVGWSINETVLEAKHDAWERQVDGDISSGAFKPYSGDFVTLLLSSLAVHLCQMSVVTYDENNRSENDQINHLDHRRLLLDFTNEYIALEFIRTMHMRYYFYRLRVAQIEHDADHG